MTVKFTVTMRQVREDGSEAPLDGGAGGGAGRPGGAVRRAGGLGGGARRGYLDHGEREKVIGDEGRELQRRLLQATFDLDGAREERAARGHQRRRDPARHRREGPRPGPGQRVRAGPGHPDGLPEPARAEPVPRRRPAGPARRPVLPGDAGPGGLPPGRRRVRAGPGGHRGPHRRHDRPRPARRASPKTSRPGRTTSTRSEPGTRSTDLPDSDVIMMQGDGKGIAMRPEHRKNAGKEDGTRARGQEDGRDRRRRRLHPRRPGAGGHRRPARPPQGAPRPEGPGQVGIGVRHREHRGHDRRRVRRGRPPRPAAGPPAGLPRRREQAADHRHRGRGGRTRPEGPGPDRLHPRQRLYRQGRRRPAPRRPRRRRAVGRRAAAARPARPREGRRRDPRLRRREDPRQPPHPPPRPHRRGQGRHLPGRTTAST